MLDFFFFHITKLTSNIRPHECMYNLVSIVKLVIWRKFVDDVSKFWTKN